MTISMDEQGTMNFSDVAVDESLQAVAPGDILMHEFMEPMALSANALSKAMKVPANRITGILNGTRNITADTALRLQASLGVRAIALKKVTVSLCFSKFFQPVFPECFYRGSISTMDFR